MRTHTHTYVVLEVSPEAHAEIKGKLLAAGYSHAIDGDTIDMSGIALEPEAAARCPDCGHRAHLPTLCGERAADTIPGLPTCCGCCAATTSAVLTTAGWAAPVEIGPEDKITVDWPTTYEDYKRFDPDKQKVA